MNKSTEIDTQPVSYDKYMAVVRENEILRNIIIELNKKLYDDRGLIEITNNKYIISKNTSPCEGCNIYEDMKKR